MHKTLVLLSFVTLLFSCHTKQVENKDSNPTEVFQDTVTVTTTASKPFVLKGTEVRQLSSSINQKSYELYVKLPSSYGKSKKSYPVLILTDSDYAFPLVTSITRRLKLEEFITVGISYSKGDWGTVSRTRDFTPTYSPNERRGHNKQAKLASGKADDFVAFIKNDVFPFLEKNYRIDASKKVFAGHSFGGLFAGYVLVTQPELFDYYLLGSPSFWYDKHCIHRFEAAYHNTHEELNAKVFFCIGEEEALLRTDMVTEMLDFEKILNSRNYKGLELRSEVIADEDHQTVYPTFITRGLQYAFGKEHQ
ncbi:MAG: alpha/beta hydrolase [Flavicella sp.]